MDPVTNQNNDTGFDLAFEGMLNPDTVTEPANDSANNDTGTGASAEVITPQPAAPEGANTQDSQSTTTPTDQGASGATDGASVPTTGASSVTDNVDAMAQLQNQNAQLIQQIEQLMGKLGQQAPVQKSQNDQQQPSTSTQVPVNNQNTQMPSPGALLREAGIDHPEALLSSPEVFEAGMSKIFQGMMNHAINVAKENVLRELPQTINHNVKNAVAVSRAVDAFYTDNQDLTGVKRTVASVANEVYAEHPDWDFMKVMIEAGERSRKLLGIHKATMSQNNQNQSGSLGQSQGASVNTNVAFAPAPGAGNRGQGPQLSKFEQDFEAMLNV